MNSKRMGTNHTVQRTIQHVPAETNTQEHEETRGHLPAKKQTGFTRLWSGGGLATLGRKAQEKYIDKAAFGCSGLKLFLYASRGSTLC